MIEHAFIPGVVDGYSVFVFIVELAEHRHQFFFLWRTVRASRDNEVNVMSCDEFPDSREDKICSGWSCRIVDDYAKLCRASYEIGQCHSFYGVAQGINQCLLCIP